MSFRVAPANPSLAAPAAAASRQASCSVPDDWPNRRASRFVDAAGMGWHVQRAGSGPGLLLVHGTAASTHTWREMLPALAESYDVLAMDLPGHAYSGRPPHRSMALPSLAAALAGLLRQERFSPRFAVGHSAGAAIVLRMVLDGVIHPSAVVGLNAALMPFGGGLRTLFVPLARLLANTHLIPRFLARRAGEADSVRRMLKGTGSTLDEAGIMLYQRLLSRERHVEAVLSMMASWDLRPLLRELPALETPLHLIVGARDKAVDPGEAASIAARVRSARVIRLDDLGHLAHEENAELLVDLVRQSCPSTASPADA